MYSQTESPILDPLRERVAGNLSLMRSAAIIGGSFWGTVGMALMGGWNWYYLAALPIDVDIAEIVLAAVWGFIIGASLALIAISLNTWKGPIVASLLSWIVVAAMAHWICGPLFILPFIGLIRFHGGMINRATERGALSRQAVTAILSGLMIAAALAITWPTEQLTRPLLDDRDVLIAAHELARSKGWEVQDIRAEKRIVEFHLNYIDVHMTLSDGSEVVCTYLNPWPPRQPEKCSQ